MAKNHGKREQKRLAKKRAKQAAKRRQVAERNSSDPTIRFKSAERWPVVTALVPEDLWDVGIGNLIIARRMPDGMFACAMLLVDVLCLGVKDAGWMVLAPQRFKELKKDTHDRSALDEVSPEYFAKLVFSAVEYAKRLDISPHSDYRHAVRLLAGIDTSQCLDEFEFGRNGRPYYIPGPHESMAKIKVIADKVDAAGGYFTIPMDLLDDSLRDKLLPLLERSSLGDDDEYDDENDDPYDEEYDDDFDDDFDEEELEDEAYEHEVAEALRHDQPQEKSQPSKRSPWLRLPWG